MYCDRPGAKNGTRNLGWISVTQVCHYWREVALATPSLWRYLDFISMSQKWCFEMLRRSGSCPIEVALRVTGSSSLYPVTTSFDVARELARPEYSARLAGLQLDLSSLARRDVESLIQSIQRSAPLLESLELRQSSWEPMTIGSLASCLPSFKRLALHNVFLSPWVSAIFLNLYELHMDFDRHRLLHLQDTLPSYEEVAIILGRMPELRCLTLRNVFAEGSQVDPKRLSGRTISLPKLQNLSLIDQQDCDLLSFASLLDLPPTACAEIKTNGQAWKGISRPASLLSHYERTFGPVRRLRLLANGHHPQLTLEFRASDALSVESSAPSQLRLEYALPPLPLPPPSVDRQEDDGWASARCGRIATLHLRNAASLRLDGLLHLEIVSHAAAAASSAWKSSAAPAAPPDDDYYWWWWWAAQFSRATRLQQIRATYRGAVDGFIMGVLLAQAQAQDSRQGASPPPPYLAPPAPRSARGEALAGRPRRDDRSRSRLRRSASDAWGHAPGWPRATPRVEDGNTATRGVGS
ncbi:hypothetical protein BJV74DRAFT_860494 [Russula compacta]|nr:hypothetical protein BJV74DRAFT_860494 [Russula compacta]